MFVIETPTPAAVGLTH